MIFSNLKKWDLWCILRAMQPALSVSELTAAIQSLLEPRFASIWVRGEISNCKQQASGHIYFSLKDATAQISAVLFKGNAANLSRPPKEGDQVLAQGKLSLYAPRGQYQIVVRELQFVGLGELLVKLHQLKEQLLQRGWFDPRHKKPLPAFPKRIGIVTSPTGAVVQDILNVLTRRFSGLEIVIYPVKVQGEGAAAEIALAIREMNRYQLADLLIVGRGGGSIEDLWAFNEEQVAEAIFYSHIPIISAVGHETDYTLADWVADVRAPTPSAAAEIAIQEKASLCKLLTQAASTIHRYMARAVSERRETIALLQKQPLLSSPYALLAAPLQRVDDARELLDTLYHRFRLTHRERLMHSTRNLSFLNPHNQLLLHRKNMFSMRDQILFAVKLLIKDKRQRLVRLEAHLRSIHPKNLLKQGYLLLFSEKENSIILSSKDVRAGQELALLMQDGKVFATAHRIETDDAPF